MRLTLPTFAPTLAARYRVPARMATVLAIAILVSACSGPTIKSRGNSYGNRTVSPEQSAGQEEITLEAMSLVGTPYRYGGNTPASGFDCSGLVNYVVRRAAGINLPRTTADMSQTGTPIEPHQLASGDLVFFNTTGRSNSHVGIYVGQGKFVHAPNAGGTVRIENMNLPYWIRRFDGVRRVAADRAPASNTPYVNRAAFTEASPLPEQPATPQQTTSVPSRSVTAAAPATHRNLSSSPDDDPIARFADSTF